jgi:hypothetical protein
MGNPFVHVELATQDVNKAKKFYKELFDWQLQDMPEMGYTIINVGTGTGGGMMKSPEKGTPSHWLAYVLVDDVATSTKKAKSLGAKVIKDATEIPGYGWLSIIADPTGTELGLWQPKAGK